MPMIGVVVCGGQSTRMGRDKGLIIDKNNATWAESLVNKLIQFEDFDKILCSVNKFQIDSYSLIFDPQTLIEDNMDVSGPLKGILSVHKNYPNHDLLIVACDMQKINKIVIEILLKNKDIMCNAVVFQHKDAYFEPLFGIYKAGFLANILEMFLKGVLKNYSMQNILKLGNICNIVITPEMLKYFKNYNSPDEL